MAQSDIGGRNKTIKLSSEDIANYKSRLITINSQSTIADFINKTIHQPMEDVLPYLPSNSVDLLIIDPPYNLRKSFAENDYRRTSIDAYETWIESWFPQILPCLTKKATVYFCCDWYSSTSVHRVLDRHLKVRNRITWEREKGRGALTNWKNASEDIWFATVSNKYTFNIDNVKLKRRVIAPYTDTEGKPKDWEASQSGKFRLTHPSNLWTDISVPFWSMPENTDHPTQKPEKLVAKLILASSNPGEIILDPFLGSGTTSVVAKKLGRHYIGIESNVEYCCLAEKRLELAQSDQIIQGYDGEVFWERNTFKFVQAARS